MNDAQRILDKTINYFGDTTVEVSDIETSYVYLIFSNPEHMDLVRKAFSSNFSSPMSVWEKHVLYGACPNMDIAKDISEHIQSILKRVAAKQRLSSFDSDWVSDLLSNHRLGIKTVGVARGNPGTEFSISSSVEREFYNTESSFRYLWDMDREWIIAQWVEYYTSMYPRLDGRKSLGLLLGQIYDLMDQCLSKDPYVIGKFIYPIVEALPQKLIDHNANLEVVKVAEAELSRIHDASMFSPFSIGVRIPINEAFNKKILEVGSAFTSLTSKLKASDSEPSQPLSLSRAKMLCGDLCTPSLNLSEGLEDIHDYIATLYCYFVSKNTRRMLDDLINHFRTVSETTKITGYFSMFSHYFISIEGYYNPNV